jgi:hypothetical protein
MPAITITRLKRIIQEELKMLREGDREEQGAVVMRACSDLIKAIEKFNAVAPAKAKSIMAGSGDTLEKRLREAEKLLKRITDSPKEYVDGPKQTPAPSAAAAPSAAPAPDGGKKVSVQPVVKKA